MTLENRLSKKLYCSGVQCLKRLYTEKKLPHEIPGIDPSTQLRMEQGREVGETAKQFFPDGVGIGPFPMETVLDRTRAAIEGNATFIFEGAFLHDDVMVKVDILRRVDDDKFDLVEVKSSTRVKPEHIPDVSIQWYVLQGNKIPLNRAFVMHLNSKHIHPNQGELFIEEDCSEQVLDNLSGVKNNLERMTRALQETEAPIIDIGPHCMDPSDCPLMVKCWRDVPIDSVFNIPRLRWNIKWALYQGGIINLDDLPPDQRLNKNQERFIQSYRNGEPVIDIDAIRVELHSLEEPLYFMDFESMNWAIPKYPGTRPHQQIPFQWSLHLLKNGELIHREFLTDSLEDPRRDFTQTLLDNIGDDGTVIVYHQAFEKMILKELSIAFPERSAEIQSIINRLWDLEMIFTKYYMDFRFQGSTSIKMVQPIIVPELSYTDLDVSSGGLAQARFIVLLNASSEEMKVIRQSLLDYCSMDTLVMVDIVRMLNRI